MSIQTRANGRKKPRSAGHLTQVPILAVLKVWFVLHVDEKALIMIWQKLKHNNLKSRVVENVKLIHFGVKCECFRARMEVKAHIAINIDKSQCGG